MKYFAIGFAVAALIVGAAVSGRVTASPGHGDTQAQRNAVAHIATDIQQVVSYYDLQWNDPPHVLSVTTDAKGNTVVTMQVRVSTEDYMGGDASTRHEFVLRGVVTPLDKLLSLRKVSERVLGKPKAS